MSKEKTLFSLTNAGAIALVVVGAIYLALTGIEMTGSKGDMFSSDGIKQMAIVFNNLEIAVSTLILGAIILKKQSTFWILLSLIYVLSLLISGITFMKVALSLILIVSSVSSFKLAKIRDEKPMKISRWILLAVLALLFFSVSAGNMQVKDMF